MNDAAAPDPAARASSRYDSRKFRIAVGVLLAAALARALGLLTPELSVDLAKWTVGLYFGANVGAAAVEAAKSYLTPADKPKEPTA